MMKPHTSHLTFARFFFLGGLALTFLFGLGATAQAKVTKIVIDQTSRLPAQADSPVQNDC
jgi:hypothetical protein